jgi:hypothetical protein
MISKRNRDHGPSAEAQQFSLVQGKKQGTGKNSRRRNCVASGEDDAAEGLTPARQKEIFEKLASRLGLTLRQAQARIYFFAIIRILTKDEAGDFR